MKLLTKEILSKLPKIYEQEGKGDQAIVYIKFFTPDAQFTWYVIEGEPINETSDYEFFGLVQNGDIEELGYFRLSELLTVRGHLGLPIERDRYFIPTKLKEVKMYK